MDSDSQLILQKYNFTIKELDHYYGINSSEYKFSLNSICIILGFAVLVSVQIITSGNNDYTHSLSLYLLLACCICGFYALTKNELHKYDDGLIMTKLSPHFEEGEEDVSKEEGVKFLILLRTIYLMRITIRNIQSVFYFLLTLLLFIMGFVLFVFQNETTIIFTILFAILALEIHYVYQKHKTTKTIKERSARSISKQIEVIKHITGWNDKSDIDILYYFYKDIVGKRIPRRLIQKMMLSKNTH